MGEGLFCGKKKAVQDSLHGNSELYQQCLVCFVMAREMRSDAALSAVTRCVKARVYCIFTR